MLVRDAIQARVAPPPGSEDRAGRASLPRSLRGEQVSTRTTLLRRLSATRRFALGGRSGVLERAAGGSGRAFRLDVRQRVVVKALVSRHSGVGSTRSGTLARHISYLARQGAGAEGARAEFFDRTHDGADARSLTRAWASDRHHFRFIMSPEHGDRLKDLAGYAREVMARVGADLGEPQLEWVAACHFDTDQPHAHVLVRGRRGSGQDLVIPRHYIGYGFRARAQEVAQELLGDLSRIEAERRVWRETEADRFTGFDRRLLQAADSDGLVADGVGRGDAWAALSRRRLQRLEGLGLATRVGDRYRLAPDLETKLRTLQIRRDIIRTLNERRLAGARDVQELGTKSVRGRVIRSGAHDELGVAPYVVVRTRDGAETYARLGLGQTPPEVGQTIDLVRTNRGVLAIGDGRGLGDLGLP
jgi:type IV secretory pathway VirD2 relaxase